MKKILITFLLLLNITHSKNINGYKTLKWGDSLSTVERNMKKFDSDLICNTNDDGNNMWIVSCIVNADYMDKKIHAYLGKIHKTQGLFELVMISNSTKHPYVKTNYDYFKNILSKKYGVPENSLETYTYPYRKGDGHFAIAVKGGYCDIFDYWSLGETGLLISVTDNLSIKFKYQSVKIIDIVVKEHEAKLQQDF